MAVLKLPAGLMEISYVKNLRFKIIRPIWPYVCTRDKLFIKITCCVIIMGLTTNNFTKFFVLFYEDRGTVLDCVLSQPLVKHTTRCLNHLSERLRDVSITCQKGYVMSQPTVIKVTWCLNQLSVRLRGVSTTCQKGYEVSQPPVRKVTWCLNQLS